MSVHRYDEITVIDLCQAAAIPRKSFYRYFSGKDGALCSLLDHILQAYEHSEVFQSQRESNAAHRELTGIFAYWQSQQPLLDALERSAMEGLLVERTAQYALSATDLTSRLLPGESGNTRRQVTLFTVCGLMALVLNWHREGYPEPPEEMARTAARLLVKPLYPL